MTDGVFPMNDSDESSASSSSSHPLASVSNSSTVVSTSAFLTSPSSNSISHLPSSSGNKPTASVSPSESDNNRHHVQQQQQQPIVPLYKPCNKEKIRTFVFTSVTKSPRETLDSGSRGPVIEELSIKIPEQLQSSYSFYTWPCAPILAWYLWERRSYLPSLQVLELGCGTALPGILAAKCGAKVTLTDNCILTKTLSHIQRACTLNGLVPGQDIEVLGVTWGLLLNSLFSLERLDLIISADCFYDPTVFEDILVSVSFLLERNPTAKFIFTYQERSADWSIEALLKKWNLCARHINTDDLGKASGVDLIEILGNHTIYLIEITRQFQVPLKDFEK